MKQPADDQPAPSVQDDPIMHSAATCPTDGTLVMVNGPRSGGVLRGSCPLCHRTIEADANLATQTGIHPEAP